MSIAGCNNGIIANELKEMITVKDNLHIGWTIPIAEKWNKQDYSVIGNPGHIEHPIPVQSEQCVCN